MSVTAWLSFIALASVFVWSVWTLIRGVVNLVLRASESRSKAVELPPWIELASESAIGPACLSCGESTIVTQHSDELTGLLCPHCASYGLEFPEFIEWQIPGEGLRIQLRDPTAP